MDEDDEKEKNELDWKEPETNKSDDADSTEIVTAPSLDPDEFAAMWEDKETTSEEGGWGCGCIVYVLITIFIIGGIIGLALIGWDRLVN